MTTSTGVSMAVCLCFSSGDSVKLTGSEVLQVNQEVDIYLGNFALWGELKRLYRLSSIGTRGSGGASSLARAFISTALGGVKP